MKIYPTCHPYWKNDDGTVTKLKMVRIMAYCGDGYIMPCCRTNLFHGPERDELVAAGLYDEELKLSNVNKVEDILISPQWLKFHRTLAEDPTNAPAICHRICGKPNPTYVNGGRIDDEDE